MLTQSDIVDFEEADNKASFIVKTDDISKVNLLRRALMSEIETYAIDIVTFNVNTSPRHDEIIALRLGQLVIDHTRFDPNIHSEAVIEVHGPHYFTTDDIPNIPFTYRTPIVKLKENQQISCKVLVKPGTAKIHVKWRPISIVQLSDAEPYYRLTFKNIGMLPNNIIIDQALEHLTAAAERQPLTIFSRTLIPADYK
jgi:DNA-directed RNA polymerase alpha subunit